MQYHLRLSPLDVVCPAPTRVTDTNSNQAPSLHIVPARPDSPLDLNIRLPLLDCQARYLPAANVSWTNIRLPA
jgi:hypothetical protein